MNETLTFGLFLIKYGQRSLKARMTISALFIDFGNVCQTFEFERFFDRFGAKTGVSEETLRAVLFETEGHGYSELFRSFEEGRITPTAFYRHITEQLGIKDLISYRAFAEIWIDIFHEENDELDRLLSEVDVRKILLSNTNAIVHSRHMTKSNIVRRHFPSHGDRILSYRVKAIKPNPAIYAHAIRAVHRPANECLFVDDMEENIRGWESLGGVGIVYHAGKNKIRELESSYNTTSALTQKWFS
jgi:putative hydrolase of the HAD superfamily